MEKFTYRGLIAPVFTPFNNDREKSLNLEIIPNYLKYLADNGILGILVNGTSGEGMSLNVQERKLLTEKWIQGAKDTNHHVMVQVGGAPLPDVLELAEHAEQAGANSLLCLPELYFKPANVDELIGYLKLIDAVAPNTPLLYYHIPSFTNVNIDMGEFLHEVHGKISTFAGIKFTSENLKEGTEAVKAHNKKYAVFLGADKLMLQSCFLGFDCAIATTFNVFPKLGTNIYKLYMAGKMKEAEECQKALSNAVSVITKYGSWVPTMKEAMNLLTPIKVGPPRPPIISISSDRSQEMYIELKKNNFLNAYLVN